MIQFFIGAPAIAGYESDHGKVTFVCNNIDSEQQLVQIPILNYDNYHAYTEDGTELSIQNGTNNRLSIMVPSGYNGLIKVIYEIPLMWTISYFISAGLFIGIIVFAIYDNRHNRVSKK